MAGNGHIEQPEGDRILFDNVMVFNHPDDKAFWMEILPQTIVDPSDQDTKTFINIKSEIQKQFPQVFRQERERQKIIKVVKRFLLPNSTDDHSPVHITRFVHMTRCFGSFTKIRNDNTCFFLENIHELLSYMLAQDCGMVSPFAGHMTQERAEELLLDKPPETYLVRFSESLASQGGFSLVVKANDVDVKQYNIVGQCSQALSNPRRYDAKLKLVFNDNPNLNADEVSYRNITLFMRRRLADEIEENIYCTKVCPNLPCNAVFRGYN